MTDKDYNDTPQVSFFDEYPNDPHTIDAKARAAVAAQAAACTATDAEGRPTYESYIATRDKVLKGSATSFALGRTIIEYDNRDPLDAYRDAIQLALLLQHKLAALGIDV